MKYNLHTDIKQRGFSLLELMAVVVVISILAAISYPTYQEHVRKTRRAQAKVDLMETVQKLERHFSARNTYVGFPEDSISNSQPLFYTLDFSSGPTATAFALSATPVANSGQASDKCGTLTINQAGSKGQAEGLTTRDCW